VALCREDMHPGFGYRLEAKGLLIGGDIRISGMS